jgi:hypothetical protein
MCASVDSWDVDAGVAAQVAKVGLSLYYIKLVEEPNEFDVIR